jgi:hypothetical protein
MTQLPVACTLSQPDLARRRAGLFADLARRRQETRWLIQLERQCCPFLRFQLTGEPGGGPTWLELTGPAGTREFLAREIGDPGTV